MLLPSVTDFSETKESLANHSAGGAKWQASARQHLLEQMLQVCN